MFKKINKYILTWAILSIILLINGCKKEPEVKVIQKNEYYIVLDTSGSMAFGPFSHVQKKFNELLSLVKTGDTIYLITFDSEPKIIKKVENYDLTQKEELLQIVQDLKPVGLYTDFQILIDYLKELVQQKPLEEEKFDKEKNEILKIQKKQFIIVLTDGKDEPPKKRKLVDIKDFSKEEELPVKDRYIYYISFAEKKSEKLEENLKTLSPNVETIERPINKDNVDDQVQNNKEQNTQENTNLEDPSGIEQLKQDIEKKQEIIQKESILLNIYYNIKHFIVNNWYYLLPLLIVILFLGFFLFYKLKPEPMKGELTFYEVGMHPSMGKTVKLSRFERKKLSIGNDPSCLIRIKSKDFPKKIELKALDKRHEYLFKIPKKYLKEVQLINNDKNVIHSGDKFKIKNYIFEYNYGSKRKKY
ncbi:MAG: hypothetical protein KatS3mg129_0357 [Leptospiraceae bacterium]|nr:MAG: hypothetical protein KatS3mg129_0357 [Leptospiraceae bacterium]